jgi:catechol 2,3-dioxygenase-like lactoylglutathione lyase family enzyme
MLGTALKVTGIDHVVLHVGEIETSKRFYIDVLGFTIAHESSCRAS